jgi:hypothetical protein
VRLAHYINLVTNNFIILVLVAMPCPQQVCAVHHLFTQQREYYVVEWAFSCDWVGMSFSRSILLPSFANLFASSFPRILVYARTLCKVEGVVRFFSTKMAT